MTGNGRTQSRDLFSAAFAACGWRSTRLGTPISRIDQMSVNFARALGRRPDEVSIWRAAVEQLVDLVPGTDHAAATIGPSARPARTETTSAEAAGCEEAQRRLGEGPGLDVGRADHSMASNDLRAEPRWPSWAAEVGSRWGIRSVASALVWSDDREHPLGALTVYAHEADAYDREAILLLESLAAQTALSVDAARAVFHRQRAMNNRTIIGQAEGMIMERYGLDADAAFAYLRRISQDSNTKLSSIAEEIVRSRVIPTEGPDEARS